MTTKIRDCLDAAKVAVDGLHKRMDALEKSALATPTGNLGEGGQFNLHPRRGPWPSKKDASRSAATERAMRDYREAVQRQSKLPEDERWKMGAEIKRLKAAAYAEMENEQVRRR